DRALRPPLTCRGLPRLCDERGMFVPMRRREIVPRRGGPRIAVDRGPELAWNGDGPWGVVAAELDLDRLADALAGRGAHLLRDTEHDFAALALEHVGHHLPDERLTVDRADDRGSTSRPESVHRVGRQLDVGPLLGRLEDRAEADRIG